jgi:hypothetical protein
MSPGESAEGYVGYLDKEMNIMGILSAFCVLTVAGIANAFKDVKNGGDGLASSLWNHSSVYIVCGCVSIMVAVPSPKIKTKMPSPPRVPTSVAPLASAGRST